MVVDRQLGRRNTIKIRKLSSQTEGVVLSYQFDNGSHGIPSDMRRYCFVHIFLHFYIGEGTFLHSCKYNFNKSANYKLK